MRTPIKKTKTKDKKLIAHQPKTVSVISDSSYHSSTLVSFDAKIEASQYDWQPGAVCEQEGKSYSYTLLSLWFQVTSPPLQDVSGGCMSNFFLYHYMI